MSLSCSFQRWRHKTVLGDKISMVVFFFGGLLLLWYELCHVASFNHSGWTLGYCLHCGLGLFFAINIYGNWIMMFITQPTGRDVVFPSGQTPPGWRYCDACVANRPPRSYHCPICQVCVLRRDHHCWFAGTCAGHDNHRYFLALVVQVTVVAVYCNVYNWPFVWAVKGEPTLLTLVSFFLPHVTGVLGQETWHSFFVTAMSMLGLSLTALFLWLLLIQCAQILRGQTRYERKKGIMDYHQGSLGANLREVLGNRLLLVLLWPWMPSPLPGDGVWFQSRAQKSS